MNLDRLTSYWFKNSSKSRVDIYILPCNLNSENIPKCNTIKYQNTIFLPIKDT